MSWIGWSVAGAAAFCAAAAKEVITNCGKKYLEEPYEERKKAKEEPVEEIYDFELEELIHMEEDADKIGEPAPKKSRKKKS